MFNSHLTHILTILLPSAISTDVIAFGQRISCFVFDDSNSAVEGHSATDAFPETGWLFLCDMPMM